jgi:hypothetical protein
VRTLSKLTTTLVVCLLAFKVYAGEAVGIHDFGADITENQSCEIAKLKATKQLIENEIGQVIQVNDLKSCVNGNCDFNSFKWVSFPGIIKKSKFETYIEERDGRRFCIAKVTGDVVRLDKIYDNDHDFSILMNKNGWYHTNDFMQVDLFGLSEQHYKIFIVNEKAQMIYPNNYQPDRKVQHLTIPNTNYSIKVKKEDNPNELLMVISSKKEFEMNSVYNIKDFVEKLMDMKSKGFRLRMYDFVVQ